MPFTKENGCVVYRPTNYNKANAYPCIIFIHGNGERGDGTDTGLQSLYDFLNSQWNNILASLDKSGNYLLVAPQLSAAKWEWDVATVQKGIDYAKTLNYNPKRLYITGVSLGGGGVWKYVSQSIAASNLFAAAVVICGVGGWSVLCNIKCPIWAFHASDDGTVGVGNTISAVDGINACNPPVKATKTIYPTGNHYIWGRVWDPVDLPGVNGETVSLLSWFDLNEQGSPVAVPTKTVVTPPDPLPTSTLKAVPVVTNITSNSATLDGSKSEGKIRWQSWTMLTQPPGSAWDVFPNYKKDLLTVNLQKLTAGAYTFKLDLVGENNQIASGTVSFTVGAAQSPVFVEGDIPSGKTHFIVREDKKVEFS